MKREGNPVWYGMKLYWHEEWDFSFWYALGWHEYEFADGRPGMILSPEEENPVNSFSVQPRELGIEVTKDDMPALTEGFVAGLMSLPEVNIESQEESAVGSLVMLDARLTFREGDVRRKRWVRLIYRGTRQYLLTGQGADEDEFRYWESMFFIPMDTFVIGPRLDYPFGWPPPFYKQQKEKQRAAAEAAAKAAAEASASQETTSAEPTGTSETAPAEAAEGASATEEAPATPADAPQGTSAESEEA